MSDDVGFVCPHCTTKIKYTAGMTFGEVMSLRHDKEHLSHKVTRLRAENERLREALKPFVNATIIDLTHNGENFVKAIVVSEDEILCARTAIKGE